MLDFIALAQQCAPGVDPTTLQAVVRTESSSNPYAIGVVGGHLVRQPRDRAEAVTTAKTLEAQGINFSMGLGQVNKTNLARYRLTYETAFDPCANLRAGSAILHDCYQRAAAAMGQGGPALRAAISCYYSGNFTRGEKAEADGTSYVERVVSNAQPAAGESSVVPAIPVVMNGQSPKTASSRAAAVSETSSARRRGAIQQLDAPHPSWDAFGDSACERDCN